MRSIKQSNMDSKQMPLTTAALTATLAGRGCCISGTGKNGHVDRDCSTEDAEGEGPKPQQKGHVGGYPSVEVRREHLSLFICKLTVGGRKRPNQLVVRLGRFVPALVTAAS